MLRKVNTREKYLVIASLLMILVMVLNPMISFAAPAKDSLKVSVKAGFNDVARVGYSVPFYIHVGGSQKDLSGEIQVYVTTPNNNGRTIYALPYTLAKGTDKEFVFNVPIMTANRDQEIIVLDGKKTIKKVKYSFKRLLPPESRAIGVLTDNKNGLNGIAGIKLPETTETLSPDLAMKLKVAAAAGEYRTIEGRQIETVVLDKDSLPADSKVLNGFEVLVIDNYDTSLLSKEQNKAIEKWVEAGNKLIIGTGSNIAKVYRGLSEPLKPFALNTYGEVPVPAEFETFTGKKLPVSEIVTAQGDPGTGKIIIGNKTVPLAVKYRMGKGDILVLTFDADLSPFAEWEEMDVLWKKIVNHLYNDSIANLERMVSSQPGYISSPMNFEHLAANVPDTRTPPFLFLFIVLCVYLVLVGPLLYIFLKMKDKRDLSWVLIPAAALLFMGFIYVTGFKTRYNTAVVNQFSVINLDAKSQKANIGTAMGVFNNQRGNMKIVYDKSLNLETSPNQNYYYRSYGYNNQDNNRVTSKYTMGDPVVFEIYNTSIWEPRFVYTSKDESFKGNLVEEVSLDNGIFTAVVKNTTRFAFKEAFLVLGNNFINVGDILPGEEKQVKADLVSKDIKKRYEDFADARYGPSYYQPGTPKKKNWRENVRKRNIMDSTFQNFYYNNGTFNSTQPKLQLYAFNTDESKYDLKVNGDIPKRYNTNIVYSMIEINLEKGKKVEIPSGIIKPVLFDQKNANMEGEGVRIHTSGTLDFKAGIPANIESGTLKVSWTSFIPLYMKYQMASQSKGMQQSSNKNEYKFYIYNVKSKKWEETKNQYTIEGNFKDYINSKNEIVLRADATISGMPDQNELLGYPELQISGVVK